MIQTALKTEERADCRKGAYIREQYDMLKDSEPKIRARNAAEKLGFSEGELVAAYIGNGNTRLVCDVEAVLPAIKDCGHVMALTRNEACVHERKGEYDNFEAMRHGKMHMGLFVNPDIDLRLFFNHWQHAFAVVEGEADSPRRSLQFFDKSGEAVHKVYMTNKSDIAAYDALVERFTDDNQIDEMVVEAYDSAPADKPDSEINWEGLRETWENLKDTHDFYPMLRKYKVGRQQAFRKIGSDFAYRVGDDALRKTLEMARDRECEIMVFVGNKGCIQIHSGPVKKLVEHGEWYNVLDPIFNLHLREDMIAETWVTKKPTEDGIVTAVEIFAEDGSIIATLFGKRKPGIPELTLWREIVDDLEPLKDA